MSIFDSFILQGVVADEKKKCIWKNRYDEDCSDDIKSAGFPEHFCAKHRRAWQKQEINLIVKPFKHTKEVLQSKRRYLKKINETKSDPLIATEDGEELRKEIQSLKKETVEREKTWKTAREKWKRKATDLESENKELKKEIFRLRQKTMKPGKKTAITDPSDLNESW